MEGNIIEVILLNNNRRCLSVGIKSTCMKNNSCQPAVTTLCIEMLTITTRSGTQPETTVLHVFCAVCEETAAAVSMV